MGAQHGVTGFVVPRVALLPRVAFIVALIVALLDEERPGFVSRHRPSSWQKMDQ